MGGALVVWCGSGCNLGEGLLLFGVGEDVTWWRGSCCFGWGREDGIKGREPWEISLKKNPANSTI